MQRMATRCTLRNWLPGCTAVHMMLHSLSWPSTATFEYFQAADTRDIVLLLSGNPQGEMHPIGQLLSHSIGMYCIHHFSPSNGGRQVERKLFMTDICSCDIYCFLLKYSTIKWSTRFQLLNCTYLVN